MSTSGPLINNFEVPSWASKPPTGLHLDVTKDGKMIQKLMIDEKKCYFFGRNKLLCDFCIDHQSCSRVHAALTWHKHLARPFIMDLGSTHGTFIGHIRLESKKPQQVPLDSELHFGASTRLYIIRERPQITTNLADDDQRTDELEGGLMGLPESETELDNLTEFNTAHNRRVTAMVDINEKANTNPLKRKHKTIPVHVNFLDEDQVINPEDIDPTVGRFRNLVQTTVIPRKRPRLDGGLNAGSMTDNITKRLQSFSYTTPVYMPISAMCQEEPLVLHRNLDFLCQTWHQIYWIRNQLWQSTPHQLSPLRWRRAAKNQKRRNTRRRHGRGKSRLIRSLCSLGVYVCDVPLQMSAVMIFMFPLSYITITYSFCTVPSTAFMLLFGVLKEYGCNCLMFGVWMYRVIVWMFGIWV